MFILPPSLFFLEFQIWHYESRLLNAVNKKEVKFLLDTLNALKKINQN